MQKEKKIFEEGADKMKNFKQKVQQTKLKNGQISHDVTDWRKQIDDHIIIFWISRTICKHVWKRFNYYIIKEQQKRNQKLKNILSEELKMDKVRLKIRLDFDKKDEEGTK